jgi:hypothetical protein
MKDRGMQKWMAYKSLSEQEKYLAIMEHNKGRIDKPLISSSKAEEINEVLSNYHGEQVSIYFFWDGYIKQTIGTISKIDTIYNLLQINDIRISFSNIVDVKN